MDDIIRDSIDEYSQTSLLDYATVTDSRIEESSERKYTKEGLYGMFVVDRHMTIRSVCTTRDVYMILQRYSLLRLLAWIQRSVFLQQNRRSNIKNFLQENPVFDEHTHTKILRYYLSCRHSCIATEETIIPVAIRSRGLHTTNDLCSPTITLIGGEIFQFFVTVKTSSMSTPTLIPLLCLADI